MVAAQRRALLSEKKKLTVQPTKMPYTFLTNQPANHHGVVQTQLPVALREAIRDESLRTTEIDVPDPQFVKEPVSHLINTVVPRDQLWPSTKQTPKPSSAVTDPGCVLGRPGPLGICMSISAISWSQRVRGREVGRPTGESERLWSRLEGHSPGQLGSRLSPQEEVANQN